MGTPRGQLRLPEGCYRDLASEVLGGAVTGQVEHRGKSGVIGASKVEVVSGFDFCSEGKENEVFSKGHWI